MSNPNNPAQEPNDPVNDAVSVEIYDQVYLLRGSDPVYIEKLAASVDQKMRTVAQQGTTVDSLRVAVLAALNIADELQRLRQRYDSLAGSVQASEVSMRSRAGSLAGMLDDILVEPTRRAG